MAGMHAPVEGHGDERARGVARARNARGVLLYSLLASAGRSIWAGDVLSAYVFLLTRSTTAVGALTGARGVAQIALAPVSGYAADRAPRHVLLRLGSCVGLAAAAVAVGALSARAFAPLCGAMVLWGCYWAVVNPAVDAIFADSVADGARSLWFTRKSQLMQLGNALGPATSLALFAALGDEWSARTCEANLLGGLAVSYTHLTLPTKRIV